MTRISKLALFILCISIGLIFTFPTLAKATKTPQAVDGILDLSEWDWEQDGIIPLDGQWEFYWEALLTPEDFQNSNIVATKNEITIPRSWNSYEFNGEQLSGNGYATYRLFIQNTNDQILGLKIPRIFTSYKLWVNGDLTASNGQVGIHRGESIPQHMPTVTYIKTETNMLEIVIQVSNFHHRSGGLLESLSLGSESQISELRLRNLALELFFIGSLFIIGFYHLALYFYRTKDKSTLYFGVYSLLICLRTLLVGEIFFTQLFPDFSWEIIHTLQTLTYYIGLPLLFLFLRTLYPNDISVKAIRFIVGFGLVFTLLVVFTPARVFTHFNPIYQLFTLALIPYTFYILLKICYNQREGAYLIALGVIIVTIFTVNDILFLSIAVTDADSHFLRQFVTKGNMSSWGLLFFVFTQALVIAMKFSGSFTNVETVTDELKRLNEHLEEKVEERTHALVTANQKLEQAYEAVSRSEKSRKHLIQNISHDLRTPLTSIKGYVGTIVDGVVEDPYQQKKYLARVIDKVNSLDLMVGSLMELSQLESRQIPLTLKSINVKTFIEDIAEKLKYDVKVSNIMFVVHFPSGWNNDSSLFVDLFVEVDSEQLNRVLTNLLSNALKHTPKGGRIELCFSISEDRKSLIIEIADDGTGISAEDIKYIFERFYKVSKSRDASTKSSGLGLAIAKEIVEYHNGQIWVESTLGVESRFTFSLPIYYSLPIAIETIT